MAGYMNNMPNTAGFNPNPTYPAYGTHNVPQTPSSYFGGRMIDDLGEVKPNETPMDGSVTLFPTKNLQEIYLRMWNRDGRLMSFRYLLDTSEDLNAQCSQPAQPDYQALLDRVSALENMIREQSGRNSSRGGRNNSANKGEEEKAQ